MKLKGILTLVCLFTLIVNSSILGQEQPDIVAIRGAFAQAIEDHDVDAILSHFTEDGVSDSTIFPAPLVTHEQMRAMWEDQFDASPDWHTEEGRVLTVDNLVIVEHPAVGTNTRDTEGLPWTWPHLDIYEFEGEKIKRLMSYGDYSSILVQLGMAPAPEPFELVPSFTLPDPEPTGLSPVEADIEEMVRYNGDDPAHYAKMFHEDAQVFPSPLGMMLDRDAWIAMYEMTNAGFSDGITEVVRRIDLGDGWILAEMRMRSKHTGTYLGVPGSGNMIDMRGAYLSHFNADGLITYHGIYWDNLTLITQMTTPEWSPVGQWITTVPTPLGNAILEGTWLAQDTAETRLIGEYKEINALPLFTDIYPEVDETFYGGEQAVKVARETYDVTFLVYFTRKPSPNVEEIVGLGVVSGTFKVVGPDRLAGQGSGAYYLASQDADQDGFPDEGEEPIACFPWTWTSKRVPMMPGCIPPPMPGQ